MKIELSHDQIDNVVVEELKSTIQGILEDPWTIHHDLSKSEEDYYAVLRTIEWFMRPSEFDAYVETLDTSKLKQSSVSSGTDVDFSGIVVNENPDGSVDFEFTTNEAGQKMIMDAGVNFIFIKGILETTDTNTVLKYALRGKQQFETDEIMDRMKHERLNVKSK